nr:class I SAM-dependent methyltransferase [Candidatus Njordarchaeum guaymaensis]
MRGLLSHTTTAGLAGSTSYIRRSSERAEEVLSLLKGRVALEGKVILDLGCGIAPLSESFQRMSTFLVGLDVSERCVREAQKNTSLELVLGDATWIPFKNDSFGFILCNDVLEHVRDEAKLMREVLRVLACNGAAYIQCANKYQIIEPHFLLPFLSWIPRTLANIYVKMAGKGRNYEGYFPKTRKGVLALAKVHRTVDLTYERTLAKIESLNIQSKVLRLVVSVARKILPDRYIAAVAQNFSIVSILVFKD